MTAAATTDHSLLGIGPGIPVTAELSREPVGSALITMTRLLDPEQEKLGTAPRSGSPSWQETAQGLFTSDELAECRWVFTNLVPGLVLSAPLPMVPFEDYLEQLAASSKKSFGARIAESADSDDPPARLLERAVACLRLLWERAVRDLFQAEEKSIRAMVDILGESDWGAENALTAVRQFLQRDVPEHWVGQLAGVRHIVFVPVPNIAFHAARFGHPDTVWIFVLADFRSLPMRKQPIQRSELLSPLRALADETRLHILELLALHGPLLSQEIIERLDVGQSTVSRHLKQLAVARFVEESRSTDANKIYRLQKSRIDELHFALGRLLSSENAHTVLADKRLQHAPELRRFLDWDGRVCQWPSKRKLQELILGHLAQKFDEGKSFTEPEVNETLLAWNTAKDAVYLRRRMIESGILDREADGSRYWRTTKKAS